ncbi:hypothetical protein H072_10770 [Dactylellina haptotyla CBS 200.50]|uniref:Peptidase S8/S53 domain-containing protein n=1 Tax=Dactylellina haptotyla (strain CBS 200.50) TaxID=1284197 RepID=S7ZZ82_DACHA|nr:hypothetical protein H072_10770 [Dactylellina haptotyla CBS 200.50]
MSDDYPFDACYPNRKTIEESYRDYWYDLPIDREVPGGQAASDAFERSINSKPLPVSKDGLQVLRNAPPEYGLLSRPKKYDSQLSNRLKRSYYHYQNSGEGVVVYLVDSGCDPSHPEFESTRFQDWIVSKSLLSAENGTDACNIFCHGTEIASKIAGRHLGIAPRAQLVVVPTNDSEGLIWFYTVLAALMEIYNHIKSRNLGRPCIVTMALRLPVTYQDEKTRPTLYHAFLDLSAKIIGLGNVIMVASAGNGRSDERIRNFPAILAADNRFRNLVVAGGADSYYFQNMYQFDNGFVNFVWALGGNLTVATTPDPRLHPTEVTLDDYYRDYYRTGTSGATAIVSGMLASYISRNMKSKTRIVDAIKQLKKFSYPNAPGGVPMIHDGITLDKWLKEDRTEVQGTLKDNCKKVWNKITGKSSCK